MKRSGVIAIGGANVVTAENGDKELEFTAVDERNKSSKKGNGVYGSAGGGWSN
jgi:hypothetical protein